MTIHKIECLPAILLACIVTVSGCGNPTQIESAEFRSMDNCLSAIKENTGEELKIISDKLGKISGKLGNGEHFTCETKTSGTKGIYVEGWYTVEG